jgi:hypothetical protein
MNTNENWLPGARALIIAMALCWKGVLAVKAVVWNVPEILYEELCLLIAEAQAALALQMNKSLRNNMTRVACNVAFAALIKAMRFMKNNYFQCPPRTPAELESLMLHAHDTGHSPVNPSNAIPDVKLAPFAVRALEVRIKNAHPYGMNGALMHYIISDEQVTDMALFTGSRLITSRSQVLPFPDSQRGKWFCCVFCWESETGAPGLWSEIKSELIP